MDIRQGAEVFLRRLPFKLSATVSSSPVTKINVLKTGFGSNNIIIVSEE